MVKMGKTRSRPSSPHERCETPRSRSRRFERGIDSVTESSGSSPIPDSRPEQCVDDNGSQQALADDTNDEGSGQRMKGLPRVIYDHFLRSPEAPNALQAMRALFSVLPTSGDWLPMATDENRLVPLVRASLHKPAEVAKELEMAAKLRRQRQRIEILNHVREGPSRSLPMRALLQLCALLQAYGCGFAAHTTLPLELEREAAILMTALFRVLEQLRYRHGSSPKTVPRSGCRLISAVGRHLLTLFRRSITVPLGVELDSFQVILNQTSPRAAHSFAFDIGGLILAKRGLAGFLPRLRTLIKPEFRRPRALLTLRQWEAAGEIMTAWLDHTNQEAVRQEGDPQSTAQRRDQLRILRTRIHAARKSMGRNLAAEMQDGLVSESFFLRLWLHSCLTESLLPEEGTPAENFWRLAVPAVQLLRCNAFNRRALSGGRALEQNELLVYFLALLKTAQRIAGGRGSLNPSLSALLPEEHSLLPLEDGGMAQQGDGEELTLEALVVRYFESMGPASPVFAQATRVLLPDVSLHCCLAALKAFVWNNPFSLEGWRTLRRVLFRPFVAVSQQEIALDDRGREVLSAVTSVFADHEVIVERFFYPPEESILVFCGGSDNRFAVSIEASLCGLLLASDFAQIAGFWKYLETVHDVNFFNFDANNKRCEVLLDRRMDEDAVASWCVASSLMDIVFGVSCSVVVED